MISFDSFTLKKWLDENAEYMIGARIQKIQQPTRRDFVFSLRNKGETKKLILYCIFTDEEVENDIIALNFHLRNSPFIGPLAIIHEPGGENE